jgi:hypothetical protein
MEWGQPATAGSTSLTASSNPLLSNLSRPTCRSWIMMASIQGYPVRPSFHACRHPFLYSCSLHCHELPRPRSLVPIYALRASSHARPRPNHYAAGGTTCTAAGSTARHAPPQFPFEFKIASIYAFLPVPSFILNAHPRARIPAPPLQLVRVTTVPPMPGTRSGTAAPTPDYASASTSAAFARPTAAARGIRVQRPFLSHSVGWPHLEVLVVLLPLAPRNLPAYRVAHLPAMV